MKFSATLFVLIFASIAASRPLKKDIADQRLEALSKIRRRREADQQANIQNALVPRYIQELYNNVTKEDGTATHDPIESSVNTIRSLQNVAPEPSCDIFNFSLSGIGSHELAKKSTLHLYMTHSEVDSVPAGPLYVVIRIFKENQDKGTGYVTSKEVVPSTTSGWLTFEVQHEVAPLIRDGESNVVFKVEIIPSIADFSSENGHLDCNNGPIKIAYSPTDIDRAPYLTIQSYDSHVDRFDYKAVLNTIESEASETVHTDAGARKKRETIKSEVPIPGCQVNPFNIQTADIRLDDGPILRPIRYNAGICGGVCTNMQPKHKHSHLIHRLISDPGFEYPNRAGLNVDFVQSCSPVEYLSLDVIVVPDSRPAKLVRLQNMRISRCDCLEVIQFSKAR